MADTDKHGPASMGNDKTGRPQGPGGSESSDGDNAPSQWTGSGPIHDSSELAADFLQLRVWQVVRQSPFVGYAWGDAGAE